MFGATIIISSFCDCHPGDTSYCTGSGGQWAFIPGSPGMVIIRETILHQLEIPRHCTENKLKYSSRFLVKGVYWLVLELNLRGRLLVWRIQKPTKINSGEGGWLLPCLHSPSPSLQLLVFPGNNFPHSSGPLIFTTHAQGILLDRLVLMVSRIYTYSHTRLFIFAINKPSSESMTF